MEKPQQRLPLKHLTQATSAVGPSTSRPMHKEVDSFDQFDPCGPVLGIENSGGFLFASRCSLTPNNLLPIVSVK